MAFVDFSDSGAGVFVPSETGVFNTGESDTDEAIGLSALEWQVVALASKDGLETLKPRRPRSRLGRLIFGERKTALTLANPRLEALRRLAVEAWHEGYAVSWGAVSGAEAAGFSDAQIGAAMDAIASRRSSWGAAA